MDIDIEYTFRAIARVSPRGVELFRPAGRHCKHFVDPCVFFGAIFGETPRRARDKPIIQGAAAVRERFSRLSSRGKIARCIIEIICFARFGPRDVWYAACMECKL